VVLHISSANLLAVVLMAVQVHLEVCLAVEQQLSVVGQYFGVPDLKECPTGFVVVAEVVVVVELTALDLAAVLVQYQP